jgi:hypothetical protein
MTGILGGMVGSLTRLPTGQQLFTSTGTWTAPAGVNFVSAVAVGGGGGGSVHTSGIAGAGSGGGLGWKNNIPVVPGITYDVVVGGRGLSDTSTATTNTATAGGQSYFISALTVAGNGGGAGVHGSSATYNSTGGTYVGDGGGNGGRGGTTTLTNACGGGGGAGGYSGNGGNGGHTSIPQFVTPFFGAGINGQGAYGNGGGGGGGSIGSSADTGGAGGGVGLLGEGASGDGAATPTTIATAADGAGGYGGSGGDNASNAGGTGATNFYSTTVLSIAGNYGGGGAASETSNLEITNSAGPGAVRLIWGTGRAFPSTNTGDL